MHKIKNVLQNELLQKMNADILEKNIRVYQETDYDYVGAISERFPFTGSKIDWSEVPNHFHEQITHLNQSTSIEHFFSRVINASGTNSKEELVIISDSAIDVILMLSVNTLWRHLENIVTLPQHTYVVPLNVSWCACFTMENDMDYGMAVN